MPEPATSSEVSKVHLGEGIPRVETHLAPEIEAEPEIKEALDDQGCSKWSNTPSLADQYKSHPRTCRKLPPQVRVFNLGKPADLEAFNKLLADTYPTEAPKYIMQTQEQAFEGSWSILARYQQIQYKILISTK